MDRVNNIANLVFGRFDRCDSNVRDCSVDRLCCRTTRPVRSSGSAAESREESCSRGVVRDFESFSSLMARAVVLWLLLESKWTS